jgi:zinc transporter, ZIP family
MLTVVALGTATALATGLGAIPVFLLGSRIAQWETALWGVAAGVMTVAAIVGLLRPAIHRGSAWAVLGGLLAGVAFLVITHVLLRRRDVHVGKLRGSDARTAVLVFAVLFVHSLPEGLAVGTAYASGTAGLGVFVVLAIALQNIPEGTSVAIPMAEAGFSRSQQFWGAVLTSSPQPVGAAIAYALVETVESLLAVSFAFAAGAMLALVAWDLLPRTLSPLGWSGPLGLLAGGLVMLGLSAALGVS